MFQERSSCSALQVRNLPYPHWLEYYTCLNFDVAALLPFPLLSPQPRKVAPASRSFWRKAPIRIWTSASCTYYKQFPFPLPHRIVASCGEPGSIRCSNAHGRCHPVAGDTLELGFVSSLALQTLTVEYFGQTYVHNILPPACRRSHWKNGLLQRPCRIRTLGRRECARRRFRRLRRHLCASPADPP